jgi:hypothetical protein
MHLWGKGGGYQKCDAHGRGTFSAELTVGYLRQVNRAPWAQWGCLFRLAASGKCVLNASNEALERSRGSPAAFTKEIDAAVTACVCVSASAESC